MAGGSSSYGGINPNAVRLVLAVMALCLGAYIVGPPLCWHLVEALGRASSYSSCSPCNCDCSSQPLLVLPEEVINFTLADCTRRDPDVNVVMEKDFTDLLAEELKLKEAEAIDAQQRADVALLEAKKLASQYQKEADKCNSGMDTCEEARERAEFMLSEQKRLTAVWETRARQRGWKPKSRS